jgi:hypothetical protein
MVEQYARGAERALRAGFDAINIQGAHGWPLARFLSPLYKPTVCLDVISLVASSCGYDSGQIE